MQEMESTQPALELGLQELEPMEAPGWATWAGISVGIVVSASAAYSGWVLSATIVT